MKLAVGYPWSSPFMYTGFGENMANLKHPEGWEVRFFRGTGWCPARRHIHFCEQADNWGADLLLIIGADQVHPEDLLCRMVDHFNAGRPFVSALVPMRGNVNWQDMKPFQPMAWRLKYSEELEAQGIKSRRYRNMLQDGELIHVIKREDGPLQRANFVGSGVLMVHMDLIRGLKKPWFYETVRHEDQQREASMDTKFSWRIQDECGEPLYIDTTIMVEHLHIFNIDDTFQDRFDDMAVPEEIQVKEPLKNKAPYTTAGES